LGELFSGSAHGGEREGGTCGTYKLASIHGISSQGWDDGENDRLWARGQKFSHEEPIRSVDEADPRMKRSSHSWFPLLSCRGGYLLPPNYSQPYRPGVIVSRSSSRGQATCLHISPDTVAGRRRCVERGSMASSEPPPSPAQGWPGRGRVEKANSKQQTTIDFPDNLLYRAKVVARERRTTLCELAVTGLVKGLESNHGQYYDGVKVIIPFA